MRLSNHRLMSDWLKREVAGTPKTSSGILHGHRCQVSVLKGLGGIYNQKSESTTLEKPNKVKGIIPKKKTIIF